MIYVDYHFKKKLIPKYYDFILQKDKGKQLACLKKEFWMTAYKSLRVADIHIIKSSLFK